MSFDAWVGAVGVLLLSMALSSAWIRRMPVSTAALYLGIGCLIGPWGLNLIRLEIGSNTPAFERVTEMAVVLSLFVAGRRRCLLSQRLQHWYRSPGSTPEGALEGIADPFSIQRRSKGTPDRDSERLAEDAGTDGTNQHEQQMKVARREKQPLALFFVDLNGLKRVNDQLGHAEGDRLLRSAAQVLVDTFRAPDIVARLSGDEFAILVIGASAPTGIQERLRKAVEIFNAVGENGLTLEMSVGWALQDHNCAASVDDLLSRADAAMYANKRATKV
jgi:diguanylate cyclase (GGDEF)-like protein